MKSKDAILARIQKAQSEKKFEDLDTSWSTDEVFRPVSDLIATFVTEAEEVSASVILCESQATLYNSLSNLIAQRQWKYVCCTDRKLVPSLLECGIELTDLQHFENVEAGITRCEYLVARTGSVVVSSNTSEGRKMHVYPPVHIVVADESQLVSHLEDALNQLQEKYKSDFPSAITVITGPSRTADIEKTLVMGAHGPKELIIFVQCR